MKRQLIFDYIYHGIYITIYGLVKYIPSPIGDIFRSLILRICLKKYGKVRVYEGVTIWYPYNIEIGRNVTLNEFVYISGYGKVKIGDNVRIGHRTSIISSDHIISDKDKLIKDQGIIGQEVIIEDNVFIGCNVTILKGVKIGEGSVIGAGSLLKAGISGYKVSAYAFFLPSINSMAPLFGYTISNTPIIILFINFFIIFAYELIKQLHRNGIYKKVGLPVALASLMLISNGSFLIVGLWHLNNNPSIIILFLLAIILDNCVENKDIGTSIVAALLITALIFARIEMLLYCAIILLGISTLGVTRQQMLIIFSISFIVMLTYFAGFFAHYGFNIVSDFLTLERAIPIITMYLLIGIYLLFIWKKHFLKLQPYVVHMICLFMIIIFFIMSFLYPAKSLSNLVVIAFHLFFHTYSGFNWHLLIWCLPILILVFLRKGMAKVPRFFLIITITYALFIVDIFLFRGVPLRYAIGDSGNRLIMQLYPFVVFLFFTQLTPLLVDTRVKNK